MLLVVLQPLVDRLNNHLHVFQSHSPNYKTFLKSTMIQIILTVKLSVQTGHSIIFSFFSTLFDADEDTAALDTTALPENKIENDVILRK
jgi:hypothetical protein